MTGTKKCKKNKSPCIFNKKSYKISIKACLRERGREREKERERKRERERIGSSRKNISSGFIKSQLK